MPARRFAIRTLTKLSVAVAAALTSGRVGRILSPILLEDGNVSPDKAEALIRLSLGEAPNVIRYKLGGVDLVDSEAEIYLLVGFGRIMATAHNHYERRAAEAPEVERLLPPKAAPAAAPATTPKAATLAESEPGKMKKIGEGLIFVPRGVSNFDELMRAARSLKLEIVHEMPAEPACGVCGGAIEKGLEGICKTCRGGKAPPAVKKKKKISKKAKAAAAKKKAQDKKNKARVAKKKAAGKAAEKAAEVAAIAAQEAAEAAAIVAEEAEAAATAKKKADEAAATEAAAIAAKAAAEAAVIAAQKATERVATAKKAAAQKKADEATAAAKKKADEAAAVAKKKDATPKPKAPSTDSDK